MKKDLVLFYAVFEGLDSLDCRERFIEVVKEDRDACVFGKPIGRGAIDIHADAVIGLFKGIEKFEMRFTCPVLDINFVLHVSPIFRVVDV